MAVPPLVLAFGFILVFSTDTLPWLGSGWLLVGGHVVLTLPYLMQTLVADMRHLGSPSSSTPPNRSAPAAAALPDVVLPSLRHSLAPA